MYHAVLQKILVLIVLEHCGHLKFRELTAVDCAVQKILITCENLQKTWHFRYYFAMCIVCLQIVLVGAHYNYSVGKVSLKKPKFLLNFMRVICDC